MGNKKRPKGHNKRKGPQLSEGERLWKKWHLDSLETLNWSVFSEEN